MIVILLGPPGVGKGTQARSAAQTMGWLHLSTGDLLRDEVGRGTELGRAADRYMSRGDLVPDDVMVGMVAARLSRLEAGQVLLLDGFPRNLRQAEALAAAAPGGSIPLAVYFHAPDAVLVSRLLARGRSDDSAEVVRRRLAVYRDTTEPLVRYYRDRGILREIDADRSVAEIQADLVRVLTAVPAASPQRSSRS